MGNNVKYLSYDGLSYFKDRVFEVINPLISENKANILSIQNFLENPVFEEVNTNTLNVISEINLNGTRLFNFDFLPLSGGTMTGTINSQSIIPTTTNTYNLGSSRYKWANVYAKNFVGDVTGNVIGNAIGLTSGGAQNSALSRDLTGYPQSKTLFTGGWTTSTGNYATNWGTTLDISYSTYYQRLAFNTTGRIEYFRGINTNNDDDTAATLTKVGDLAYLSDIPTALEITNAQIDEIFAQ